MRIGFAQRDITPTTDLSLSGFIFRMNRPSEGVDDPLFVRALAVEGEHEPPVILLAYDLLGIGVDLHERIIRALTEALGERTGCERVRLLCTHTHGAPAAIHLENCGIVSPGYWDQVVAASADAAQSAMASVSGPVDLVWQLWRVPGVSYHRRKVLLDGRVVMARHPDAAVVREGEADELLFVGRFAEASGQVIAGIAHFSAHACTVLTNRVTADYPGALCAGLSQHFGAPFLFLQGASGDVNPVFDEMAREDMLANVNAMMEVVRESEPSECGSVQEPVRFALDTVELPYARLPEREALIQDVEALARIAHGDLSSSQAQRGLLRLGNILNTRPGEAVDAERAAFAAGTMAKALKGTTGKIDEGSVPTGCPLSLAVLRMGNLLLPMISAEVFAETGRGLERRFPDAVVRTVGYGSPLCGYLPTGQALRDGGYESADAYIFYGHPAPFAGSAEQTAVERTAELMAACMRDG